MFITNENLYKQTDSYDYMISKEELKKIVKFQREQLLKQDTTIKREKVDQIDINLPFALIISGIRRSGKSTLMKQLIRNIKKFYYINFEDPKVINFEVSDFSKLDEVFIEEYGENGNYFFDEIQNVKKWELFIRRIVDEKKHVVITGSNASLLSRELGTRLTGRHLKYELFPFSFKEFLKLKNKKPDKNTFKEYLFKGGFPEYLKIEKSEILEELFKDIIIRDIITRHKIKSIKIIEEMALYLMTNVGKEFSYNSLKKIFNLGSINSVISFISYFEDSYLLFTVSKFDFSFKKRLINQKKVYSIDNGLSSINSTSFSEDSGRMLENMVFLNLRKKNKDIFYFKENKECDFVIREGINIVKAIQVCYEFNADNQDREIGGLLESLKKFKLKEGLILTYDQEEEFKIENKKIIVKPVWKWLLE